MPQGVSFKLPLSGTAQNIIIANINNDDIDCNYGVSEQHNFAPL